MFKNAIFKLFVSVIAATAPVFIFSGTQAQAGRCMQGMSFCAPGQYGSGGCYKPGYASCTQGMICSSGLRVCKPGRYGKGGCYRPVYANCTSGLICTADTQPCIKGGRAYCYNPYYGKCK